MACSRTRFARATAVACCICWPAASFALDDSGDGGDLEVSGNVALVSQYIFRGITYTREKPAVQGSLTLSHRSGAYLGIAGTNVNHVAINNTSIEIDVFGGYAGSVGDFTYDVGFLQFLFPGGKYEVSREKYSTLELNAGVGWKNLSLKYSHAVTDYFGYNNKTMVMDFGMEPNGRSRGSNYLEAAVNFELPYGFAFEARVGRQVVRNYRKFDFTDHRLTLSKTLAPGWLASVSYIDTNARSALYTDVRGLDTSRAKWLASLSHEF